MLVLHFAPPARQLFSHRFDDSESWWIHFWTERVWPWTFLERLFSGSISQTIENINRSLCKWNKDCKCVPADSVLQHPAPPLRHHFSVTSGDGFSPWVTSGNHGIFNIPGKWQKSLRWKRAVVLLLYKICHTALWESIWVTATCLLPTWLAVDEVTSSWFRHDKLFYISLYLPHSIQE